VTQIHGKGARLAENANILALAAQGAIKEIMRRVDRSRGFNISGPSSRECFGLSQIVGQFLRRKGGLLMARGASGRRRQPKDLFRQALDSARRQGAQSWKLRAATARARIDRH
jgi:hypothetical protein